MVAAWDRGSILASHPQPRVESCHSQIFFFYYLVWRQWRAQTHLVLLQGILKMQLAAKATSKNLLETSLDPPSTLEPIKAISFVHLCVSLVKTPKGKIYSWVSRIISAMIYLPRCLRPPCSLSLSLSLSLSISLSLSNVSPYSSELWKQILDAWVVMKSSFFFLSRSERDVR